MSIRIIALILRAVALAMGVSVALLANFGTITVGSAFTMLGLGLSCLAVSSLDRFHRD